jgi:hypothetical protein
MSTTRLHSSSVASEMIQEESVLLTRAEQGPLNWTVFAPHKSWDHPTVRTSLERLVQSTD